MVRRPGIALVALAALCPLPAAGADQAALAVIDVVGTPGGIEVVGRAVALTDAKLSGRMSISRQGASGTVSTSQGSELDISAGESADIARVGISFQAGDRLEVTLVLTREGEVVSEAVLRTGQ